MATRNIVPRATGEGSIGTSAKTWSAVYANDIAVTNGVSASTFTGNLTGTASGNLALSGGTVTGDLTVTGTLDGTASGNLPLSGGTVTGDLTVTGTLDGTASGNLPLSGGTLTGVVNGVTPPNGDNSKKLATTEFVAKSLAEARVLPGTVTAFSGTFNDGFPIDKNTGLVNKEWHLCDGTNGTPDLRNRFIYGGDGTNSGATGGEATHKLTVDEMPPHDHESPNDAAGYFAGWGSKSGNGWVTQSAKRTDGDNWRTKSTGGGRPHNNMPPYFALAYIMRL